MSRTISNTITTGLTLVPGDTPLTIANTGVVSYGVTGSTALYGPAGTTWIVTNLGTISDTGAGWGVNFAADGTVINGGLIAADVAANSAIGVYLSVGGSVTNQSGGTITGHNGVKASNVAATVVNAGRINLDSTSAAQGVLLNAGGSVTNQSGGVILGYDSVLIQGGTSASVVNAGSIGAINRGIALDVSGSVTNLSTGTITSSGLAPGGPVAGTAVSAGIYKRVTLVNAGSIGANASYGVGIYFAYGQLVSNQAGGVITALNAVRLGRGTVINAGSIGGNTTYGTGVSIASAGGIVTNQSGGTIAGQVAVKLNRGTVVNAGVIAGDAAGYGVSILGATGTVTNQAGGSISGFVGVQFIGGTATNAGVITGYTLSGYGFGMRLFGRGTVSNLSTGTIRASTGVTLASGILENAGTIVGVAGTAVAFSATAANRVIVDPGAVFSGTVDGGNTIGASFASTLELASGASAGTLNSLGSQFIHFANITADAGAAWSIASGSIGSGYTVTDAGTLTNAGTLGSAVTLGSGARLTNAAAGAISLSGTAVVASAGSAAVVNAGTVAGASAGGVGVNLAVGGSVTNQSGGTILGYNAIVIQHGTYTAVVNAGSIGGARRGVELPGNGSLTNAATGTITSSGLGLSGTNTDAAVFSGQGGAVRLLNAGRIAANIATGDGVNLASYSSVTNQTSGTISGYVGVRIAGYGTLVNAGSIAGHGYGYAVRMTARSASVVNQAGGTIRGEVAVGLGQNATLVNVGNIVSSDTLYGFGIHDNANGAIITNQSGGLVSGGDGMGLFFATVINAGSIAGNTAGDAPAGYGYGININSGSVTNLSTGTIRGVSGVVSAGGTLRNAGSVVGSGGTAVLFGAARAHLLILDPSGAFSGIVDGGNTLGATSVSTMELASGASAGTLNSLGSQFIHFSNITVDSGASWTVASGSIGSGYTITDAGTLTNAATLGSAVTLGSGARLTNAAAGTIATTGTAVSSNAAGSAATVVNAGSIAGLGTAGIGIQFGATSAGGTVINQSGGTIGGARGIDVGTGTAGTVVNAGSIGGSATGNAGILLAGGGAVTNQSGGTITGEQGVYTDHIAATVINAGSIGGNNTSGRGSGVWLNAGGTLTNLSTGLISGNYAVVLLGGAVTVANAGTIAGNTTNGAGAGVYSNTGGLVTNQSGGTITGYQGVWGITTALTVVNAGSIAGNASTGTGVYLAAGGTITDQSGGVISGGANAVKFGAGHTNRLVVAPSASFIGTVDGGNTIGATSVSTLELASAASAGTLSGLGTQFVHFAAVTIDSGASWTLSGTNTVVTGATLTDSGTLINRGTITGNRIVLSGGALTNQASGLVTATYVFGLAAGGTDTVVNAGTITSSAANAIYLAAAGNVSNAANGAIGGYGDGVKLKGVNATLNNLGRITGSAPTGSYGAYLRNGGLVTNGQAGTGTSTASLRGYYGVAFKTADTVNAVGTLFNYGSVTGYGSASSAVLMDNAGIVVNGASGASGAGAALIQGGRFGVSAGFATITNYATILATGTAGGNYGVFVSNTGIVRNLGSASSIRGYGGVQIGTDGTVINAGTIASSQGTTGVAVSFIGGNARLIDNPGAVFVGTVNGGSGGTAVLELASGSSAGTISGLGSSITNFTSLVFDAGAQWTVRGNASAAGLGTLAISGFADGDTIDLTGFVAVGETFSGNQLVLTNASDAHVTLGVQGTFTTSNFALTSDLAGGTDITVICFAAGTLIATPAGEVPVQDLAAGNLVMTAHNGPRPVQWIGKGKVLSTRGRRTAATPVIVYKNALGPNLPHHDLRITKAHSLYIDDVLIPVEFLVNHRTIVWDDRAQEVEIYHVELESHDILIANGVPVESYRDDGNRWLFQNANSGWGLPPQTPYAPVLTGGPVVDAVWARLLLRAGPRSLPPTTDDPDLHLIADGIRVDVAASDGQDRVFFVSGTPDSIRIVSRDAIPAELGIARDPRALGVAVREIVLERGLSRVRIAADDPRLTDGFHDYEPSGDRRWTNGDASLPAELSGLGALRVVLTLAGATRYLDLGQAVAA